jgi:hypothetical protein
LRGQSQEFLIASRAPRAQADPFPDSIDVTCLIEMSYERSPESGHYQSSSTPKVTPL